MAGPFVPAEPEQPRQSRAAPAQYRAAHGEIVVRAEADQIVVKLAR